MCRVLRYRFYPNLAQMKAHLPCIEGLGRSSIAATRPRLYRELRDAIEIVVMRMASQ